MVLGCWSDFQLTTENLQVISRWLAMSLQKLRYARNAKEIEIHRECI